MEKELTVHITFNTTSLTHFVSVVSSLARHQRHEEGLMIVKRC